jgi:hypothetical protein
MAGRKSKYHTHVEPYLDVIAGWCRGGADDIQIAEKLGIALSSFYKYKNEFTEFSEALRENKEFADVRVMNAMYKRAIGFEYEEVRTEYIEGQNQAQDGQKARSAAGNRKKVTRITKKVLADVRAQTKWLDLRNGKKGIEPGESITIRFDKDEAGV